MKLRQWIGLGIWLAVAACAEPPQVVQGQVVSYQPETKLLVVKDELPPYAEMVFVLDQAELGAEPAAGDLVRVAFRRQADKLSATRVMDLTRQKELSHSGGH